MSDTGLPDVGGPQTPTEPTNQVAYTAPAAGPEPAKGTANPVQEPADAGKVTRLEQELAKYSKVMTGLGIDPESDFADRFLKGIAGKEEIAAALGLPVQTPTIPDPPKTADQRLRELVTKIEQEGASESDIKQSMQIMAEVIEAQNILQQQQRTQAVIDQCKQAVFETIGMDARHKTLPPELQEIEKQLFLSSTDAMVADAASRSTNPNSYLDPRVFKYYAEQNAAQFNKLREHWKASAPTAAPHPHPANGIPSPLPPTTGVAPSEPAQPMVNIHNLKAVAQQYVANRRTV